MINNIIMKTIIEIPNRGGVRLWLLTNDFMVKLLLIMVNK